MSSPAAMLGLLVCAFFMWSTGFVIIKASLVWLNPLTVMTLRMLPPLAIYLVLRKQVMPEKWLREDWKWFALMVLGDPIGTLALQSQALRLTTASQAGMIFACMPLIMSLVARVFFGEAIRRRCLIGIGIAFSGVSMVALTGTSSAAAPNPVLGNLLSLCAMGALICYSLTVKRLSQHYKAPTLLFVQALGANCIQLPLFFVFWPSADMLAATPAWVFWALLYTGVFPACLGYLIVNRALGTLKAAHVSLLNTLVPVFVLILGHIALGERLIPLQYFGAALVFGGVILAGIPESTASKNR